MTRGKHLGTLECRLKEPGNLDIEEATTNILPSDTNMVRVTTLNRKFDGVTNMADMEK